MAAVVAREFLDDDDEEDDDDEDEEGDDEEDEDDRYSGYTANMFSLSRSVLSRGEVEDYLDALFSSLGQTRAAADAEIHELWMLPPLTTAAAHAEEEERGGGGGGGRAEKKEEGIPRRAEPVSSTDARIEEARRVLSKLKVKAGRGGAGGE